MNRYPFRCAVITGATSGIGRALAEELAGPGVVLGLTGRDAARLAATVQSCEARGAAVVADTFDVASRDAMESFVRRVEAIEPVDLVIANAGLLNINPPDRVLDPVETAAELISANLTGLCNTVDAALAVMMPRGRGYLGLMSSTAAITPLPHAPTYSATKAAVKAYGDALRPRLAERGIAVSVIVPGHVDTPMDRSYASPKPLQLPVGQAARIILRGLGRRRAVIAFPWLLYLGATLASRAPVKLKDRIMKRMRGVPLG